MVLKITYGYVAVTYSLFWPTDGVIKWKDKAFYNLQIDYDGGPSNILIRKLNELCEWFILYL
jgi:hypothetical protein